MSLLLNNNLKTELKIIMPITNSHWINPISLNSQLLWTFKALLKWKRHILTTANYQSIDSKIVNITKKYYLGTKILINNLINNGQIISINMVSRSGMMDRLMVLTKEANIKIIRGDSIIWKGFTAKIMVIWMVIITI